MLTKQYPPVWNHHSQFADKLRDLVIAADCEWLQTVTDLSFMMGVLLVSCDNREFSMAVYQAISAQLLAAARDGLLPGQTIQ